MTNTTIMTKTISQMNRLTVTSLIFVLMARVSTIENLEMECLSGEEYCGTQVHLCSEEEDDRLIPDLQEKSAFYKCFSGITYRLSCPKGFLFQEDKQACSKHSQAEPWEIAYPIEIPAIDPDAPCTNIPTAVAMYFPHPRDCSKYFQCYKGTSMLYVCAKNLHYDRKSYMCKPSSIAQCTIGGLETLDEFAEENALENAGDFSLTCAEGDGDNPMYYPDQQHCERYYKCIDKVAYQHHCPSGMHFHPGKGICDDEESVKCNINKEE